MGFGQYISTFGQAQNILGPVEGQGNRSAGLLTALVGKGDTGIAPLPSPV